MSSKCAALSGETVGPEPALATKGPAAWRLLVSSALTGAPAGPPAALYAPCPLLPWLMSTKATSVRALPWSLSVRPLPARYDEALVRFWSGFVGGNAGCEWQSPCVGAISVGMGAGLSVWHRTIEAPWSRVSPCSPE